MKKRPFSKKQIQTLRKVLIDKPRDLALLNVGVDTALRGGDLLSLKVSDVKTGSHPFKCCFGTTAKRSDLTVCGCRARLAASAGVC